MEMSSIQFLAPSTSLADEALWGRDEILGMLGHDLGTPLNGLQGFLDLLNMTSLDGYPHDCLETALGCASDLEKMLKGVLDSTRLRAHRLGVQGQPADLPVLVRCTMNQFRLMAEEKGLTLDLEVISDLPALVTVDRTKIQQILGNLIGNAIKFTDRGGVIGTKLKQGQVKWPFTAIDRHH